MQVDEANVIELYCSEILKPTYFRERRNIPQSRNNFPQIHFQAVKKYQTLQAVCGF